MSEPVSNAEVEDVLASIRRLVSEEKRPAPRGPSAATETASVKEDVALVLTPALRISDDTEYDDTSDAQMTPEDTQAKDSEADAPTWEAPEPVSELATDPEVEDEVEDAPLLDEESLRRFWTLMPLRRSANARNQQPF